MHKLNHPFKVWAWFFQHLLFLQAQLLPSGFPKCDHINLALREYKSRHFVGEGCQPQKASSRVRVHAWNIQRIVKKCIWLVVEGLSGCGLNLHEPEEPRSAESAWMDGWQPSSVDQGDELWGSTPRAGEERAFEAGGLIRRRQHKRMKRTFPPSPRPSQDSLRLICVHPANALSVKLYTSSLPVCEKKQVEWDVFAQDNPGGCQPLPATRYSR